jgi:signal transduction histidine kinase/putative methionine-R-sulfoxide reductase with GAF domain
VVLVLRAGEEPVGVLFVNFRKSQTFDPLQRLLVTTLAYFAAIAIKNHQALQILRSADFKVLQTIDQKIGETFELKEIISTILELAVKHVSAADAAVYLYDQRTISLKAMATRGTHEHLYLDSVVDLSKQNPQKPKGLIATAFFKRVPILENDVRKSTIYKKGVPSTRAELDVPLIDPVTGESVGVINLESGVPYAFNEAQRDFMVTLAGQAVVALKNAQIYERVTNLNSSVAALLDISRKIVSTQGNQKDAFRAILEKAREFFKVEIAVLQLYDTGMPGPSYIVKDRTPGVLRKINRITPDRNKLGIIKHVAKTRKYFLTNDTDKEPLYRGAKVIRSELAVPMIFEGALIGVLDLESINPSVFTDDDVSLIELFSTQAILVVQSARRLLEARSAAEVEHKRLELLSEATHELNAVKEPEQLEIAYDIVINKVADFSTGETIIRRYLPESRQFKLVRIVNEYEPSPEIIPEEGSWNGRAKRERQVIAEQNLDDLPPGVPRPIAGNLVKSIVLAPVEFADSYYGTLIISHKEPNVFNLSDVNLLKVLATQLAVTLKRLEIVKTVRDTEKSNREMSVLSNVGKVAMSISHDLSNSLAPVQFSAATLLNLLHQHLPKNTPRRAKLLAEAEAAANTINEKMRNASDFTQRMKTTFSSTLQNRPEPQAVSVNMLLDGVIAKYRDDKTIKLVLEVQSGLGTIETSPPFFEQVFDYLISNAKEAMRKSRGTITVRAYSTESKVILSVSDTGPGIKSSLLETIFEFGYTTKKRGQRKGTGFGLWHAREIVESYKGILEANSQPGHGATFIVKLPLTSKGDVFEL